MVYQNEPNRPIQVGDIVQLYLANHQQPRKVLSPLYWIKEIPDNYSLDMVVDWANRYRYCFVNVKVKSYDWYFVRKSSSFEKSLFNLP